MGGEFGALPYLGTALATSILTHTEQSELSGQNKCDSSLCPYGVLPLFEQGRPPAGTLRSGLRWEKKETFFSHICSHMSGHRHSLDLWGSGNGEGWEWREGESGTTAANTGLIASTELLVDTEVFVWPPRQEQRAADTL